MINLNRFPAAVHQLDSCDVVIINGHEFTVGIDKYDSIYFTDKRSPGLQPWVAGFVADNVSCHPNFDDYVYPFWYARLLGRGQIAALRETWVKAFYSGDYKLDQP